MSNSNPNALPSDLIDTSAETGYEGEAITGGLHSGGQINERGGEPVRVTSGPVQTMGIVAMTPEGFRISNPADLRPDSIVTFQTPEGPQQTTYEVAVMQGLISPTGQMAPNGPQQSQGQEEADQGQHDQQRQHQDQGETGNTSLDEQSESYLTEAFEASTDAAVFAATDTINSGAITQDAVENIAAATGVEPAVARQRMEHVAAAYEKEAYEVTARKLGTSEDIARDAIQAARTEHPDAFREAAMNHFQTGKPAYERFVRDYVSGLDQIDPGFILNANSIEGRRVHYDDAHRVVVVTDTRSGRTFTWSDAVRLGLIGIKGPTK